MWGIVPAAGVGSRIQPLAFSKELLPVYGEQRKPRAVSDYLVERMVLAGAENICFVISAGKSDIMEYYGGTAYSAPLCYVIQPEPVGLCDSLFRALPVIDRHSPVLIGLPDTIWYPESGFSDLPDDRFSFLLFPVERPEFFDAVLIDDNDRVIEVRVKHPTPGTHWVWGAFKMPGSVFEELFQFWCARGRTDEYVGTLVNAWIAQGGTAYGCRTGERYFDVGTMDGYMQAMLTLQMREESIAR